MYVRRKLIIGHTCVSQRVFANNIRDVYTSHVLDICE